MPRSQLEKFWLSAGALAGFVMLLIGYFMFIGPQRSQTSDVNSQKANASAQIAKLQGKINTLAAQTKNLATYQSTLRQAELALPSTSGLPDFLRTLQAIGNSTLANVSTLTVGTPTDVTSLAGVSPAATTGTRSGTGAAASSVAGIKVYALPITAQVDGTVTQLDQFLTQLQSVQPRAVLISQINQASNTSAKGGSRSSGTTLTLTLQAFVAPNSAAEQAQLSAAAGK
jgi:Tfp pilus assembly protein PilO